MDGDWLDEEAFAKWLESDKPVGDFRADSGTVHCEKRFGSRGLTDVRISVILESPNAAGEGAVDQRPRHAS
jgi:hypothetical protein